MKTLTLRELMSTARCQELELLIGGVWFPVAMTRASYSEHGGGRPHFGEPSRGESGYAEFRYWPNGSKIAQGVLVTLQASEIHGRVRYSFKDRLLTKEEIEHIRTHGREQPAQAVTLSLAEFEALCRSAAAAVPGFPDADVEKIVAAFPDWNKGTAKIAENIAKRIKDYQDHAKKLADELNGPTGAREEARALRFRAAESSRLETERDAALKANLEKHMQIVKLEDELLKLRGAHQTFLEREELKRRQEILQKDLESARAACKLLREEVAGWRERNAELAAENAILRAKVAKVAEAVK